MSKNKKTTEELMTTISQSKKDLKQLIEELEYERLSTSLHEYLMQLLEEKNLTPPFRCWIGYDNKNILP